MTLRNVRDIRPRHGRLGNGLLLLRHRPRSTGRLLRRPQSAVIAFHHALQYTAHAARETYAIEKLQSMRPDRTVTVYCGSQTMVVVRDSLDDRGGSILSAYSADRERGFQRIVNAR
jgi:hypothetical protein